MAIPLFFVLAFTAFFGWTILRLQPLLLRFDSQEEKLAGSGPISINIAPEAMSLSKTTLSPVFTPEVQRWGPEITSWAAAYDLDPNLIALVMQIESCGHSRVVSGAGALGLFQVMPYHFGPSEDAFDPHTNAARGLAYLARAHELAGGRILHTLAGFNGGHSVISKVPELWAAETQRYARWGAGIFAEIQEGARKSSTLESWLESGGSTLCKKAAASLAMR